MDRTRFKNLITAFIVFLVLIMIMTFNAFASGPQVLSPEVHEALRAMASGTATPRQEAILFANNDAINKARLARQIPDAEYQAAQNRFKQQNVEFAAEAAKKAGAEFEVQKSKSTRSQPGTDSDYITKVKSSQQIQDMQTDYNRQVNEYLQRNQVTSVDRADWHNKLDTDFMADASGVSKAEFERIAEMNNDAYSRRAAADWEYKSRNPDAGEITQYETKEYVKEMEDFRNKKQGLIEDLQGKGGDIERGSLDEGKLTQKQAQQQKYDSRIGDADARYRADHGLSESDNPTHELAKDGSVREPDVTPEKARELLGMEPSQKLTDADMATAQSKWDARRQAAFATEQNIRNNATRSAAEGIMENANTKGGDVRQAASDAAEIMENMTPAEKGRFMTEVQDSLPKDPKTGDLTPEGHRVMRDLREQMAQRTGDKPVTKNTGDVEGGPRTGDVEGGPKTGDIEAGPKTGDVDVGPRVGDIDGPKVGDIDGPKVADLDGPKVGDVDGPKVGDIDGPKSRFGGALQRAGEVMTASDILNTGQDVVDLYEGKKTLGEVAENAAVNFTPPGQVYSAASGVDKKTRDLYDAELEADNANRSIQQSHAVTAALEARKNGATKEEAQEILMALRNGYPERAEQLAQDLRDRGIDYNIPKAPEQYEVEADDTVIERAGQVATGIGSQLERAGQFVWDTAKNVDEIRRTPGEIFDDEVTVAINQIRQNQQQSDIYDKFIEQGADPAEAAAAVDDYYNKNKLSALRDLRQHLQERKKQDELAQAMQDNADTPQDIADWRNGNQGYAEDARDLIGDFSDLDVEGYTKEELEEILERQVTQGNRDVKKDDIREIMDANRRIERAEDVRKIGDQRDAENADSAGWQTTMTAINAVISQLNQADAQKVTQKTQEAIALIQQMQNGTIDDSEFTSKMTALENEYSNLQQQGQQGWQRIIDQLMNGQVNNNPGTGNTVGTIGSSGDAASDILNSVPPDQIDQRSIVCDTSSKSGNNTPASISVDMKGGTGTATVSYSLYSVKDRLLVQVNGGTVSDTGCTNGSASIPVQVSGGDQVRVIVQPACEGSSTSWNFSVSCPKVQYVK
ncbi:MAG: hypothetical protein A2Y03_03680 [Omnitrophica WOR_2 bacterium GWF2_38_59]|nr:MAG: hypothetical protein A2Y03_03680 [Omnitrophica WOR_2 bacterium GWF2_38_59]OGX50793.1 MAG: hypothetical protein A2243_07450 [Omnitrophica WOR_2 bacterium RIFOXYA2_FULL_38_17]OGX60037.1 MAG: hypothetical protein A2306_02845 [Omnitrophica WOR_2 bacterium RIFOXYB2_FULL_38_16]HBG60785.1 hypothetical protein [Candidatus Omnitrophota bacterium]